MKLINAFAIVLFVSFCSGFKQDEKNHENQDKDFLNCAIKKINISEYIVPALEQGFVNKTHFSEHIDLCAKTINDSIDLDYIKFVSPKVLELHPPFDFSGHRVSEKCRRSSESFISSLQNFELWALKSKLLSHEM